MEYNTIPHNSNDTVATPAVDSTKTPRPVSRKVIVIFIIVVCAIAGVLLLLMEKGVLPGVFRPTHSFKEQDALGIVAASTKPTEFQGYPLAEFAKIPVLDGVNDITVPAMFTPASDTQSQISLSYKHKTLDDYKTYLGKMKALGYKLGNSKYGSGMYITETQFDGKDSVRVDFSSESNGLPSGISISYRLPVGAKVSWPSKEVVPFNDPIAYGLGLHENKQGASWSYTKNTDAGTGTWNLTLYGYSPSMKEKIKSYMSQPQFEAYQLRIEDSAKLANANVTSIVGDNYKIYGTDNMGHEVELACGTNGVFGPFCMFTYDQTIDID